jgi:hypothetical protein
MYLKNGSWLCVYRHLPDSHKLTNHRITVTSTSVLGSLLCCRGRLLAKTRSTEPATSTSAQTEKNCAASNNNCNNYRRVHASVFFTIIAKVLLAANAANGSASGCRACLQVDFDRSRCERRATGRLVIHTSNVCAQGRANVIDRRFIQDTGCMVGGAGPQGRKVAT